MTTTTRIRSFARAPSTRSGLRFAVTIVVVDLIALALFGETTAALIASLAVCVHLYFLDYEGDLGERFTGQAIASAVGAIAVLLGVACASPLWLAIVLITLAAGVAYATAHVFWLK